MLLRSVLPSWSKQSNCEPLKCSGKKKTGPKKTALKFEYDGEDLTCLEQRLTQAEIDRVLGSDLLVRAVFHGQADVTALLEVTHPSGSHQPDLTGVNIPPCVTLVESSVCSNVRSIF